LSAGCSFPFSSDKFTTEEKHHSVEARTLLESYSEGSDECMTCMLEKCGDSAQSCVETEDCVETVECIRERASPAGRAYCIDVNAAVLDTQIVAENLSACWTECFRECEVRPDFECINNFTPHRPIDTSIVLTQRLSLILSPTFLSNAKVTICPPLGDCSVPLATTTADENGVYSVAIEVYNDVPGFNGFNGYRVIEHPLTGPVRLETNLPIWSDRYEETLLVSENIFASYGLESEGVIFAQIFDCRSSIVEGVVFEINHEEAEFRYLDGFNNASLDTTTIGNGGSGFIYNLKVDQEYEVIARLKETGQELARGDLFLPKDHPVYFGLYPSYRETAQ